MSRLKSVAAFLIVVSLCACKVGPNYKRPDVSVPGGYRGVAPDATTQAPGQSFADLKWAAVFQDEVLQGLLKEALTNNYDIRIAASRIQQANAIVGIRRADQFPSVSAGASIENQRSAIAPG